MMTTLLMTALLGTAHAACDLSGVATADLSEVLVAMVYPGESWPDYVTVFDTVAAVAVGDAMMDMIESSNPSTQDAGYGVEAVFITAAYGDARVTAHFAGNVLRRVKAQGIDGPIRGLLEAFSRVRDRDDMAEVLNTDFGAAAD